MLRRIPAPSTPCRTLDPTVPSASFHATPPGEGPVQIKEAGLATPRGRRPKAHLASSRDAGDDTTHRAGGGGAGSPPWSASRGAETAPLPQRRGRGRKQWLARGNSQAASRPQASGYSTLGLPGKETRVATNAAPATRC
eukprot:11040236-Alexandrium_andersonii.AAC.1